MKSGRSKIFAIALAIAVVGAVAVSQTVTKTHHHMGGGFGLDHMVGLMTDYLDLTDAQQAQVMTELTVEKAKIHSQIFNILTPEQKTKATQFLQRREERFQKHMQQMQQAPPAQQ